MPPRVDMKPFSSELVILKHLWSSGASSVGEIHGAISPGLGWSRSSSRKTIERMVDKGLLSQTEKHGLNIYRGSFNLLGQENPDIGRSHSELCR
jgi:predicted transcriptional regulator